MNDFDTPFDTHEVRNTVAPLENFNLFTADPALREAVLREGGGAQADALQALGGRLGRAETLDLARLANQYPPTLRNFDRAGHRIDEVEFHPAWHGLMTLLIENGAHASPWLGGEGAQVARERRHRSSSPGIATRSPPGRTANTSPPAPPARRRRPARGKRGRRSLLVASSGLSLIHI